MYKHPDVTLRRVIQFEQRIEAAVLSAKADLSVEYSDVSHPDENTARKKGPWAKVEPGFEWGPAYHMGWFRVVGSVPKDWDGSEVRLIADLGGERTLWEGNSPSRGIDEPHWTCRLFDAAKGGAKIDLLVQAYAMGNHIRVHGDVPERLPKVAKFERAQLVVADPQHEQLMYDLKFGLSLLKGLQDSDPAHAVVLRAMNECCNVYDPSAGESVGRCRKLIRDALGSLNGELKHSITPVGHAHLDTAWLWPLRTTHLKMAHTTATQLYQMDRYPEYVFAHSQASQYEWLEKEYPVLYKRVKAAMEKGQWEAVGSMWVEADCNLTGAESLVRQFLYGRRYFRKHFGVVTEDMWLPDVFGYSAAIPQILEKFGIKYFLTQKMSWNQFNKFPHNTFFWQGIDGSKVWTHFPPADTYNASGEPEEIIRSVKQHKDQGRSDQSLYLFGHGDGGGGPTEQHLELVRRARTAPCMPEVESRKKAVEFFRDARAKGRDLLTWSGELYGEFHRGTYTSQAANKKGNRESEFLMRDVEMLHSFSPDFPARYPAEQIEALWKLVLLNQFHDIIPGSSVTDVYEDSAKDYARIREEAKALIQQALKAISGKLDTGQLTRPIGIFQNANVASQASLPWSDPVVPASLSVGGDRLPVQLVEAFGERHLVFATPHEALGSVAVGDLSDHAPTTRTRLKAGNRRLENDEFSIRFDANGNITSIQSLDDQPAEFIEPGKLANLFQLLDDRPLFWEAWDVDIFASETAKDLVKCESFEIVERGPVRVAVEVVRKFGKSTIRQRISLGPTPGIRFDTEVDWREERKMLKVAFPINVNATRATYEIQFGNVERPTHKNTSWDMARFEVCAQKWVDVSEGGMGVALLNDCKYGHDVSGNVLRLSLLKAPKAPDPIADIGVHRFTYVLMPHFDGYQHADVVASAYAVNAPPRVVPIEPSPGVEGEIPRFVTCENRNLVVETVKKAEDSNRLVVRLYECHNSRGRADLLCARGVRRAWLADLNEDEQEELEVVDGVVSFGFKPFEIITLLLES